MLLFVTLVWFVSLVPSAQSPAPPCATADTCRAQALIAEAAGDFEHFHDLAWRAVQKGKPNDPELMVMLARAMALSGRPGDAIVMLSRLADMGVKVDASGDEFHVVRTLKEWPDVEAKLAALNSPVVSDAAAGTATVPTSKAAAPPEASPTTPTSRSKSKSDKTSKSTPNPEKPGTAESENSRTAEPENPTELSFSAPAAATSGLAYDAVSRRFLVSDRKAGGLMVIDEVTQHVVPLVSAAGAGFYDNLTAFRIDPRRGDLWVVSARMDGEHAESVLHKLQLVSGRTIFEIRPTSLGDVRFVDVAVDAGGTVYALDAADSRIFRVRPGGRAVELVTRTTIEAPTAFDLLDDRTAIVAGSAGLSRVDLVTGHTSSVSTKAPLGAIEAIDVNVRTIFLLQKSSEGEQLVRCKLDRNERTISSVAVVDAASAIGRAGDKLYYVAAPGVIKSVRERP